MALVTTLLLLRCATADNNAITPAPTPPPMKSPLAGVPVDLDRDGIPDRWTGTPVKVDTTGNGQPDSEAVDTTGNGRLDTLVHMSKTEKMLVANTPVTNPDSDGPTSNPVREDPGPEDQASGTSSHRDGELTIPLGEQAEEVTVTADDDDSPQAMTVQVPMDTTGDGVTDSLVDAVEVDLTGNGRADALAIDTTGDGEPDTLVVQEAHGNHTAYVRGASQGYHKWSALRGHDHASQHSRSNSGHGVGVGISVTAVVLFGLITYMGRRSEAPIYPQNWQCCKQCKQPPGMGGRKQVGNPINSIEMTNAVGSVVVQQVPKADQPPLAPSSNAVAQQWAIMDGMSASL